jgi:hypothetical protein
MLVGPRLPWARLVSAGTPCNKNYIQSPSVGCYLLFPVKSLYNIASR